MPTTLKNLYGTLAQPVTVTLASLANDALRQSTAIDNTTNLHTDALASGKIKTGTTGTSATGYVAVYASGQIDAAPTYGGDASGSDAAYTGKTENLRYVGKIAVAANATTYTWGPLSVAAAFDGVLPPKWSLVFENKTGGAMDATAGNFATQYQGINEQSV
jgi:hypothetical protein